MAADAFAALGLSAAATDAEIRRRYLELTVKFPPEQRPAEFAAVRAAYEKVRTLHDRAAYLLHGRGTEDTIEAVIEDVECSAPRPRPALATLLPPPKTKA